jgi:hypothetical protein
LKKSLKKVADEVVVDAISLYSHLHKATTKGSKMQTISRKYQVIDFDDIKVGDRIQRKTPTGARFSNTYTVTAVTEWEGSEHSWTIIECGSKWFFRHYEADNMFRKVLS